MEHRREQECQTHLDFGSGLNNLEWTVGIARSAVHDRRSTVDRTSVASGEASADSKAGDLVAWKTQYQGQRKRLVALTELSQRSRFSSRYWLWKESVTSVRLK